MALQFPYFVFLHLYDSIRDNNWVTNRWIYIDGGDGTVSGQTDSTSGQCAINVQNAASTNGDILTIYDGTFKYDCKLDVTTPSLELNLYQNASNSNDVYISLRDISKNEVSIFTDNLIKKDINIKTCDY